MLTVQVLLTFLKYTDKPIDALTTDDVDTFLTEKRLSGISPETYNHYHSGIRFFYKKVLKMNWDDDDIPRMKRDRACQSCLRKQRYQRFWMQRQT